MVLLLQMDQIPKIKQPVISYMHRMSSGRKRKASFFYLIHSKEHIAPILFLHYVDFMSELRVIQLLTGQNNSFNTQCTKLYPILFN